MIRGIDTNVLSYALDPDFPEHRKCQSILLVLSAENKIAVNPTVIHETYHTLVYMQKWERTTAHQRLTGLLNHPYVEFYNQSRRITMIGLELAAHNNLGGRDALILANLMANNVSTLYTHDGTLLSLGKVVRRKFAIRFEDPLV